MTTPNQVWVVVAYDIEQAGEPDVVGVYLTRAGVLQAAEEEVARMAEEDGEVNPECHDDLVRLRAWAADPSPDNGIALFASTLMAWEVQLSRVF